MIVGTGELCVMVGHDDWDASGGGFSSELSEFNLIIIAKPFLRVGKWFCMLQYGNIGGIAVYYIATFGQCEGASEITVDKFRLCTFLMKVRHFILRKIRAFVAAEWYVVEPL